MLAALLGHHLIGLCRRHVGLCRSLLVFVGLCWSLLVFVGLCRSLLVFPGSSGDIPTMASQAGRPRNVVAQQVYALGFRISPHPGFYRFV